MIFYWLDCLYLLCRNLSMWGLFKKGLLKRIFLTLVPKAYQSELYLNKILPSSFWALSWEVFFSVRFKFYHCFTILFVPFIWKVKFSVSSYTYNNNTFELTPAGNSAPVYTVLSWKNHGLASFQKLDLYYIMWLWFGKSHYFTWIPGPFGGHVDQIVYHADRGRLACWCRRYFRCFWQYSGSRMSKRLTGACYCVLSDLGNDIIIGYF